MRPFIAADDLDRTPQRAYAGALPVMARHVLLHAPAAPGQRVERKKVDPVRLSSRPAYRIIATAIAAALLAAPATFAAPALADTTSTPTPAKPDPAPSAIPVPTDPATLAFRAELARRQAAVDAFTFQLDQLDREFGIAAEEYNAAAEALKAIQERLDASHSDLGAAAEALTEQQSLLDTRLTAMYKDGQSAPAEILLGSTSIPDFLERLDFVRTISSADADLAKQLRLQHGQVSQQEADLKVAEIQAQALEFSLKARKIEIELRLGERQAMLASAQSDLLSMLDSEASRRSSQENVLWREILSGAGKAGATVDPYSPAETILSYHGIPYVWAGAAPSGFDCSGLTMYVMRQHGVELPHHAASQYLLGTRVPVSDLRSGDLVFFGSPVYHVGMYIGGGYFVQAPRTGDFVKVSKLADRSDFVGARRYAWKYRTGAPMGVSGVSLPSNLPTKR
jgi:peptidoglycan hydrolase CwlO-like protein